MSIKGGNVRSAAALIAFGVLCGLGAAGLIVWLTGTPRGTPIVLLPAPTRPAVTEDNTEPTTAIVSSTTGLFPLNINTATLEELQLLPDIGPSIAIGIINYRESHNGFATIEEIMNVAGIGPVTFQTIQALITVE
jgi:competence ComEA-like helix-hairpin-helix protein